MVSVELLRYKRKISMPILIANPNADPGTLFFISMIFMFLYFPLWFFFAIYAVVAAVKNYKGRIFRYLIVGKIIEKRSINN